LQPSTQPRDHQIQALHHSGITTLVRVMRQRCGTVSPVNHFEQQLSIGGLRI
jgi:hypothetical protein